MMWRLYFCFLLVLIKNVWGFFDYGATCTPGTEWTTGECGEKCRCLLRGITHCAPNPCVVVKHNGNGEVQVQEMSMSDSGISLGRDITKLVDKRVLFPDKTDLHKRFLNYGQ
ncbi:hypothetical protein ILUMI_25298 [Ignelater luminosus]|uniref:Uncharacterized protein n=1 Tax=Ignelater luminosus TaxID=2038154 RepID=A0A8K0C8T8_IGNLU|nr:hypothetical protein ILUMI_25298 [Ignelater luminosus]